MLWPQLNVLQRLSVEKNCLLRKSVGQFIKLQHILIVFKLQTLKLIIRKFNYFVFEIEVRKLVHQVKVVIFKPHVLSNVHKLYLSFNESSLGPLGQLTLGLLRCTFDLV